MADNRASKHTDQSANANANANAEVEQLRSQRDEARAAGDTAKVEQLEQQLRQAGAE